jgi:GxxExxY protein
MGLFDEPPRRGGRQESRGILKMTEERCVPSEKCDALATAIIGAAIEVHRNLGPGYLESVYEEALAIECELRGIPIERQKPIAVMYKGRRVGRARLDIVADEILIVELKTVESLAPIHTAIMISYLRSTSLQLGLLINFNTLVLKDGIKRVVLT